MSNAKRLQGLRALLQDAVDQGTSAVERVHRATAARPFDVLDHIPPVAPAARGVRIVHDATVAGVYETIRQVNRLVGVTLAAAIDLYDASANPDASTEGEGVAEPVLAERGPAQGIGAGAAAVAASEGEGEEAPEGGAAETSDGQRNG
jgi:hypothetical protein